MDYEAALNEDSSNPRKQRRQMEERKRMAFRRAIEDYRESQALQAQFCDFPELLGQHKPLH